MNKPEEERIQARRESDGLFSAAPHAAGTLLEIGLSVASVPLVLLPDRSRRRVRPATPQLAGVPPTTDPTKGA